MDKKTNPHSRHFLSSYRQKLAVIALVSYWIVLFLGTHWPTEMMAGELTVELPSDKSLHVICYCLLSVLLALPLRFHAYAPFARMGMRCLVVGLVVPAFGLFDEATQPLMGRFFDWWDWLADVAGAACGVVLIVIYGMVWHEIRRRQSLT